MKCADDQHRWASYYAWALLGGEWIIDYEKCLDCGAKRTTKKPVTRE